MALTVADVVRLAHMARFEIAPDELERFRVQLNEVLERISELEHVKGEEAAQLDTGTMRLRDDVVCETPLPGDVDALSEHIVARFFTVPQGLPAAGAGQ